MDTDDGFSPTEKVLAIKQYVERLAQLVGASTDALASSGPHSANAIRSVPLGQASKRKREQDSDLEDEGYVLQTAKGG